MKSNIQLNDSDDFATYSFLSTFFVDFYTHPDN